MNSVNNKIIVRVNMQQKQSFVAAGIELSTATNFDTNYRERQPVICQVINGNDIVGFGDILVCHHNLFYDKSPYYLYDDLFSIPANKVIFAKLNLADGSLFPIYGHFLCDRVDIETKIPLPPSQRKKYLDRVIVVEPSYTRFKKGQLLLCTPYAAYEIVYIFDKTEYRVHKCHESSVCGIAQ